MKKLVLVLALFIFTFLSFSFQKTYAEAFVSADTLTYNVYKSNWYVYPIVSETWSMRLDYEIEHDYVDFEVFIPANSDNVYTRSAVASTISLVDTDTSYITTIALGEIASLGLINITAGGSFVVNAGLLTTLGRSVRQYDEVSIRVVQAGDYSGGLGVPSGIGSYFSEYGGLKFRVPREIEVVFMDKNSVYGTETLPYGLPARPIDPTPIEGYTFVGWKTITGEFFDFNSAILPQWITEDSILFLYAYYRIIVPENSRIYINYTVNGGLWIQEYLVEGTEDNPTGTSQTPFLQDGYKFVGWRTPTGEIYDFDLDTINPAWLVNPEYLVNDDLYIYDIRFDAVFERINIGDFTVKFYDGFSLLLESEETGFIETYPENPSRAGYTFLGWETKTGVLVNSTLTHYSDSYFDYNDDGSKVLILRATYGVPLPGIEPTLTVENNAPDFLNNFLAFTGLNSTFGQIIFFIIILVLVSIILVFIKAQGLIFLITTLALTGLFIYFGYIPVYLAILLFLISILLGLTVFKKGEI